MGRPAIPTSLKLLHGTSAGRDSSGHLVAPAAPFRRLPPEPPAWLSPEALTEWRRVAPELARLDVLKAEDQISFAAYCESVAVYIRVTIELRESGTFTAKIGNRTMANPLAGAQRAASRELRAWAGQFGLTAASESMVDGALGTDTEPSAFDNGA